MIQTVMFCTECRVMRAWQKQYEYVNEKDNDNELRMNFFVAPICPSNYKLLKRHCEFMLQQGTKLSRQAGATHPISHSVTFIRLSLSYSQLVA